jgi:hypothetical protein
MATTLLRIDQLHKPDSFDDTLGASTIASIESNAVDHADFWEGVLSQVKRIIHGNDSGNWHDDMVTVFGTGKEADLKHLANRPDPALLLYLVLRLQTSDATVPATQNYVALAGANKPDKNIAISTSNKGAVTAQLAGAIGSHSLTEISGANPLKPKNLCYIFDGGTGDPITSSGRRVYGLLQVGSAATDGNAFADSGNDQGQISFVRPNATYDDLEACPAGDIENKTIIYAFSWREALSDIPEEFLRGDIESADPQAGVTISLDSAYDGGHFIEVDGNDVDIRLADTKSWVFRNGSGGTVIWQITRNDTTGDTLVVTLDSVTVNVPSGAYKFQQGIVVDDADQDLNLGVTAAGVIDSATAELRATTGTAKVAATGTLQDVSLEATDQVLFTTVRETAIPLDDVTAGAISGLTGGPHASISAAIAYAIDHGGVDLDVKVFVAASNYGQGVNIPAATFDLTTHTIDMNTPANTDTFVFLNGRLLYGGNGTTKNDVYAGTTPANGDIMVDFPKGVKTGDVIISISLQP